MHTVDTKRERGGGGGGGGYANAHPGIQDILKTEKRAGVKLLRLRDGGEKQKDSQSYNFKISMYM